MAINCETKKRIIAYFTSIICGPFANDYSLLAYGDCHVWWVKVYGECKDVSVLHTYYHNKCIPLLLSFHPECASEERAQRVRPIRLNYFPLARKYSPYSPTTVAMCRSPCLLAVFLLILILIWGFSDGPPLVTAAWQALVKFIRHQSWSLVLVITVRQM